MSGETRGNLLRSGRFGKAEPTARHGLSLASNGARPGDSHSVDAEQPAMSADVACPEPALVGPLPPSQGCGASSETRCRIADVDGCED